MFADIKITKQKKQCITYNTLFCGNHSIPNIIFSFILLLFHNITFLFLLYPLLRLNYVDNFTFSNYICGITKPRNF